MRVVQIFDAGHEPMYKFEGNITDEQIKTCYEEFVNNNQTRYTSFETYMKENYPAFGCERFFIDSEIYI